MKPISLAFLCLIAMAPFLLMAGVRADMLEKGLVLRTQYDAAIDNAISDASWVMAATVQGNAGYAGSRGVITNGDAAIVAFFDSLYAGLGAANIPAAEARVQAHVPVLLLVGNEGASLLVRSRCTDLNGVLVDKTIRLPERPYLSATDVGTGVIRFTLGDVVEVMNPDDGVIHATSWKEMGEEIPAFSQQESFDEMRLDAVTKVVRELLEAGLEMTSQETGTMPDSAEAVLPIHGAAAGIFSHAAGIAADGRYRFNLPRTDEAEFRRAVSQVGVFAFVQGLPVGGDKTYDTFAFGGGRVTRTAGVVGYLFEGRFLYCEPGCPFYRRIASDAGFDADTIRFFSSAREAAAEGYQACSQCRP